MNRDRRNVRWAACIALACAVPRPVAAQQPAQPTDEDGGDGDAPVAPPVGDEPESVIDLEQVLRGQGRGMTADRAAELAVSSSPSVERARETVEETRQGAQRAMYGLMPEVSVSARYTRLSPVRNEPLLTGDEQATIDTVADPAARELWNGLANDPLPLQRDRYQFLGTVSFPVSDAFVEALPRWEANERIAEAQRVRVRAEASKVALSAREAFYQYARARGALAVARVSERQAELRQEQVKALQGVGHVGRADVLGARARLAGARVAVARAEGGVEVASTALRTLLHLGEVEELAVGEDVLAELPERLDEREELVQRAVRRRPEAQALRQMIAARQRAVDSAEGKRLPSLILSGGVQVANPHDHVFPETDKWRLSAHVDVILEWSLQETLHGGREVGEKRAQVGQAQADLRAVEDAIVRQVTEAHVDYRAARRALEAARLGVDAAEESYRVRMAQFRTGDALTRDLIDASAEQTKAQLDLVNAAIDARVALARLRRAVAVPDEALPHPRSQ